MSVASHLPRELRTALAMIVAAASAGLASTALIYTLPGREYVSVTGAPVVVAVIAALSLPILLTFGIVWHMFALNRGWCSWRKYATAGAIAGLVLGALVGIAGTDFPLYAVFAPIVGAISAITFWIVRRPDRDAPNPRKRAS